MRDNRIDIFKGLAIISVIILHTLSPECLTSIYRIFHINQAVPMFMLVSGYIFTLSYKSRGITDFKSCYNFNILTKRIKRLYIPFLVIYFLEILLSKNFDTSFIIYNFIRGGLGPGGYYVVMMLQFLLIFPIIYIIAYKKSEYSILIFFTVGMIFEFFSYFSGMSRDTYGFLIGRYIFAIAVGSYLALNQNKIDKKLLYGGSILSITYMYTSVYLNYHVFIHDYCLPLQAPAFFYTALLFVTGMNLLKEKSGIIWTHITKFGEASWHILLVQMFYFYMRGYGNSDNILAVITNLSVCVFAGYLFYVFELHTWGSRKKISEKIHVPE